MTEKGILQLVSHAKTKNKKRKSIFFFQRSKFMDEFQVFVCLCVGESVFL